MPDDPRMEVIAHIEPRASGLISAEVTRSAEEELMRKRARVQAGLEQAQKNNRQALGPVSRFVTGAVVLFDEWRQRSVQRRMDNI